MGGTSVVLQEAFKKNPERFVRGLPKPPALPEQVWINKPKATVTSNQDEPTSAENSLVRGLGPENGSHICPTSNDQESGRDLGRGQNQLSADLAQ